MTRDEHLGLLFTMFVAFSAENYSFKLVLATTSITVFQAPVLVKFLVICHFFPTDIFDTSGNDLAVSVKLRLSVYHSGKIIAQKGI